MLTLDGVVVSLDVETNGPVPGCNSMWSLGAVAFDEGGAEIGDFSANLLDLPGAEADPSTMEWWGRNPGGLAVARADSREPAEVMGEFVAWLRSFRGPLTPVAYPAAFDYMFVYWYMIRFVRGKLPLSFSCLDIKTYATTLLGKPYRKVGKSSFPREWFEGCGVHYHVARDDAREQGRMLFNMVRWEQARGY